MLNANTYDAYRRININTNNIYNILFILQQQVPLPLPCFNFAQITILSLTPRN